MSWRIRDCTESDLAAVIDLYAGSGLDDGVRMSLERARELFRRMMSYPNYRLLVAEADTGTVEGTYALLIMDNIAHEGRALSIVEQVAVSAASRGQGLGTAMMRHAMDESRKAGCYKLALSSNVKFEQAHRFYERLGFIRHGYSFVVDFSAGDG